METHIIPRNCGKTTMLIKKSAETGDRIICCNEREANMIEFMAQELNLDIPFPISYNKFLKKHYVGNRNSGFLLDNVDRFLEYLCPEVPINHITVSS